MGDFATVEDGRWRARRAAAEEAMSVVPVWMGGREMVDERVTARGWVRVFREQLPVGGWSDGITLRDPDGGEQFVVEVIGDGYDGEEYVIYWEAYSSRGEAAAAASDFVVAEAAAALDDAEEDGR